MLSLQGQPCGGDTNAGGFLHLSTEAVFRAVRFIPPSADIVFGSGGFDAGGPIPGTLVQAQGSVGAYEICPVWDGDQVLACTVQDGPKSFESRLVLWPGGEQLPPAGPTPDPAGSDETLSLDYSLGSAAGLEQIMGWECGDFHIGCFGSTCGSPNSGNISFLLYWDWIMAGQELTLKARTEDGWGTGNWTMRLAPSGEN
jgi:hypothetical protein